MLAQSFKSAADLEITEPQLAALQKTLVLLETGKLKHVPSEKLNYREDREPQFDGLFNMDHSFFHGDCGTVACIRGTATLISGVVFPRDQMPTGLYHLFYSWGLSDPDTSQAATALRSYLTTGDARWDLAVAR